MSVDRSRLVEVFQLRFAETRDIASAVDAVAREVEACAERGTTFRVGPRSIRRNHWTPDEDPRVEAIIGAVASLRDVPVAELKSPSRDRRVTRARHEACWLIRVIVGLSYALIGWAIGRADHTTVLVACRKVQALVNERPAYGETLLAIVPQVRGEAA